jgi:hypothetical protein
MVSTLGWLCNKKSMISIMVVNGDNSSPWFQPWGWLIVKAPEWF